jgi:Ca2+:H+ antiporter
MVASSQGGDGSVNYNPFARTRNREHIKDAENPVYSIRSEPPQNLATGSGTCPVHSPQSSDFSLSTQSQATLETYGFNFVPIASVPSGMHNEKSTAPEITKSAPLLTSAICGSNTVTNRAKLKAIFSKAQTNELDDSELTHAKPDELTLEERNKQSLKRYIPIGSQIKTVLLYNWVATILLPCIAIGFTVNYIHANAVVVFCINFAAIIPSATALSVALNEIHIRSGEKTSALLNQTFG